MTLEWGSPALALLVLLFTLGGVLGCVPHQPWRVAPVAGQQPPPTESSWLHGENKTEILIVEFDDQGEVWRDSQRDFALTRIEEFAKEESPLTVLVFVPGWHHSARDPDKNLADFQKVLGELAGTTDFGERRWVGVYLGWRGESVDFPLLRYLTYWNRRSAAARVGGIPVASLFADLASIVHGRNDNMLVVIGHSFGARVVETAVTNGLPFDEGTPTLDLVVLLNEASEALRAKTAIDRFKKGIETGQPAPAPQIVSITSVGDTATKRAFPFGQWWLYLAQQFQDYQVYGNDEERALPAQVKLFRHTAGHTGALWSHVVKTPDEVPDWQGREDVTPFSTHGLLPGDRPDHLLVPLDGNFNHRTPYWIIQVPQGIVDDHNDIFNENLRGMLGGIVAKWFEAPAQLKEERQRYFLQRKDKAREDRRLRTPIPEKP
jgi:hypothetical protein